MVTKSRIYTRTGDKGQTSLANGKRVPKNDIRMQICGTFDEANAFLGLALAHIDATRPDNARIFAVLRECQHKLFATGAQVASVDNAAQNAVVGPADIAWIEGLMDNFDAQLPGLKNFILPGGSNVSAYLHVARTVVRRAERDLVKLVQHNSKAGAKDALADVGVFINRLSDLLFILARTANNMGKNDILWQG